MTTAKLSDPTGTYGVKRDDNDAVVVADGTAMTKVSTGLYEYEFDEPAEGLAYTGYVEFVHDGETFYFEHDIDATIVEPSGTSMLVSYTGLKELVGRKFFGIRTGFSTDQLDDIVDCIREGLHSVYLPHQWSFLRLRKSITMVADTYTYDLPSGFDAIEGDLTYAAGESDYYPPVKMISERELRRRRQDYEYSDRPIVAAVITEEFDADEGSMRQLVVYPTPDDAYVLTGIMRLRPTMIDNDNLYPIGGEVLARVITEACLAAGERLLEEEEGVHTKRFQELLAAAIASDKDAASPGSLGRDDAGEVMEMPPVVNLIGSITLNGEEL